MKICYFGTYCTQEGYPRNNVIIKGLRKNGIEVIECHVELWKGYGDKARVIKTIFHNVKLIARIFHSYFLLVIKFFFIRDFDIVLVGYPGFIDIFLAKCLTIFRRRPLVFDAFISLYDTLVGDRKMVGSNSFKARLLWLIDKYACLAADRVLLDTDADIDYFAREFGIKREKFIRVPVGEDDDIFKPVEQPKRDDVFRVLFFGTYLPLHGLEFIVKAANLLRNFKDIHFILVGSGADYDEIQKLSRNLDSNNIEFIKAWKGYDELKQIIAQADVCLGIFGLTDKARRVVPCKVYASLAMAKPLITGDSPSAREMLQDGETAVLCRMADPEALRDKIAILREDSKLRDKIAKNGHELFTNKFTPLCIARELLASLERDFNI